MSKKHIINIEGVVEHISDYRDKQGLLDGRISKIDFIGRSCNTYWYAELITNYDLIVANQRYLLPVSLNCTNENLDLISIINLYTSHIVLDLQGGVWIDLGDTSHDKYKLHDLKKMLERYWTTHPLCSNKVDKYRRIVAGILDTDLYVK